MDTRASELLGWLKRATAALGSTLIERLVSILMIVAITLGLVLRARGYLWNPPALWLDEAVWAMNLTERPLAQNLIRPPGFILVSKALSLTLSPTETVLRALPWAAGVAATLVSPWFAKRLYGSLTSRLLFVAVIALNPCAIDFSKEFKPYSIGLLLHMLVIPLALRYVEKRRGRDLGIVLGVAGIGSLFAQDLIFAYPGLFLVLGYEAFRHRRQHLPMIAAGALLMIGVLLGQYLLLWRHLPKDGSEYWGNKYNVFFTGKQSGSYFRWSLERYRDMTGLPGIRRDYWQEGGFSFIERQQLRTADRVVWLAMHLMGLMVIVWRRRFREGALIVLPLLVLWFFNALGHWPMGAFRTNVFTLVYTTAVAGMAFDVPESSRSRWFAPFPALVLVGLPLVFFERTWHERKMAFTYDSQLPKMMEKLLSIRQDRGRAPLILDRRTCQPWRFYTTFHPKTSKLYAERLKASYDAHCLTDDAQIPEALQNDATGRQAVWIVLHPGHNVDRLIRARQLSGLYRISRFDVGPHTAMSFRRRPDRFQ